MKPKILAVLMAGVALGGPVAVAWDASSLPSSTDSQSDEVVASDDFAENRRMCLQLAYRADNPEERQRRVQHCQQDVQEGTTAMSTPMTPAPTPAPRLPNSNDNTDITPNAVAASTPPNTQIDQTRTLPLSRMSPWDREEQRILDGYQAGNGNDPSRISSWDREEQSWLPREQQQLALRQEAWVDEWDRGEGYDVDDAIFSDGQSSALPPPSEEWENSDGGDEWAESPDADGRFAGEPDGAEDFVWRSGIEEWPGTSTGCDDDGGSFGCN